MKILSIGNFGKGWDGSICDEENIAQALEVLGHEVSRWPREYGAYPLTNGPGKPYFDFILIAQWDKHDVDFLHQAKRYFFCPLVYWAFDYQADGQEWHERLVKEADLYLSKRIADSKYPNWRWACDFAPNFLLKYDESVDKDIDVLFTGSYLPWATERNETLKAVDENFDLTIHSFTPDAWREQGFKHVYGPVMDYDLPALIARAKVNLAIDHTLEAGYWSDRAAQAIACGGFVLHRYVPLLESYLHSNITYFYDKDDCLAAVQHWLEHDEDREVIAAEAYENSPYYKCKERVADVLNIIRSVL